MFSLSGCGFKWPEWATLDSDPLYFLGDNTAQENTTPPPPLVISKDEPDQNAPQPDVLPSSTMGLNLKTYFAQDIKDPATRMQRLENVVVAIHKDMQNMQPAMAPVALVPTDIMVGSAAQTHLQGYPTPLKPAAAIMSAAVPAPTPQTSSAQSYAQPASGDNVDPGSWLAGKSSVGQVLATGIRVGEHGNKVRVVFDVTKNTKFRADLDNSENLLVVELPEAAWRAPPQAKFPKMALFDSYRVDPFNGGAGSIAVIQLKKGTKILKQMQIPALSGGGKRIYIDLAK